MAENKIDLNAFLGFVGIEPKEGEELNQETLHEMFSKKYVAIDKAGDNEDVAKMVTGRRMGSLTTTLKQQARELGVEFGDDAKDKKFEELLTHTFNQYKEKTTTKMAELEKALESGAGDEALKEWQTKYSALESKFSDTQSLLEQNATKFEEFKKQTEQEKRDFKLNSIVGGAMSTIKYKNNITDVERAGFKALVNDKYQFNLDEENNPYVVLKETGKRIPNKDKMNEFLSIQDVLSNEAKAQNIIAINDKAEQGGAGNEKGVKKLGASVQAQAEPQASATGRKLSPRAQANAEKAQ